MTASSPRGSGIAQKPGFAALLLFVGLFGLYNANLSVLDEGDAVPTAVLPLALLETGKLSFDPDRFPELFRWRSHVPLVPLDDFFVVHWKQRIGPKSAGEWRAAGALSLEGPRYYVVEAPRRHTYVSTFGPLPGLVALPIMAPFYAVDRELAYKAALRASVTKLGSSAIIAGCAVLLFLIARRRTSAPRALLLAAIYGVGTCAWAVSSQNLWQQTVNQGFLTLGAYFFLGDADRRRTAFSAGFAFGAAAACRPTGLVALALVLVHLYREKRASVPAFLFGASVLPLAVAGYNQYYFGVPFALAQEIAGHAIAMQKTGSPDLWQTPILVGAAGLLASPSRGLLVFSPLLGLSFWGVRGLFRDDAYRGLRPLAGAALITMAAQCKWFDWWGGWAYGYRPWLDSVPYLVLFLLPVLDRVLRTRLRRALVAVSLVWSAFIQGLGALAYDRSWNDRRLFVVTLPNRSPEAFPEEHEARSFADAHHGTYLGPTDCNVDFDYCRYRLWSIRDNVILYHLEHYSETRAERLPPSFGEIGKPL